MRIRPVRTICDLWACGDYFCSTAHASWWVALWHGVLAWLNTEPRTPSSGARA